MSETQQSAGFDQWAVIEIMGHKQLAGHVTEEVIAGTAFVRVDVPVVGGHAEFTQYIGAGSIYRLHPCTEAIATQAAARIHQAQGSPLPVYLPDLEDAHRTIEEARRLAERSASALAAGPVGDNVVRRRRDGAGVEWDGVDHVDEGDWSDGELDELI